LLHLPLLIRRQHPEFPRLAPTYRIAQCFGSAVRVSLADVEYAGAAQPSLRGNSLVRLPCFAQSDHLHPPLMPRVARQRSHVCRFHQSYVETTPDISSTFKPDQ
jgi:hypothetical protein